MGTVFLDMLRKKIYSDQIWVRDDPIQTNDILLYYIHYSIKSDINQIYVWQNWVGYGYGK